MWGRLDKIGGFFFTDCRFLQLKEQILRVEDNINKHIKESGWFVAMFDRTNYLPSFAYTIGLWKNYGHPELIVFGLTTETLHEVLNIGGEKIKQGKKLETDTLTDDFFQNSKSILIEVDQSNIKDYFGYAIEFYGKQFPAFQIVWTDRSDHFPWEEGYEDEFKYQQPLLDRNARFKFREDKNLGVITDRYFLEDGEKILYVEHDSEGDWTFLTGEELNTFDARLVFLEEVIERDSSLNDLFNLDYGEYATRQKNDETWTRVKK